MSAGCETLDTQNNPLIINLLGVEDLAYH